MTTLPLAAWRLVVKRARHDRLVVAATFLTLLLATTLLASGPIYAEAVALSGLQRTLGDASVSESGLQVSARLPASAYGEADLRARRSLNAVFGSDGADVHRSGISDSFALPDAEEIPKDTLAVLAFYDELDRHARLASGSWPRSSSTSPVEAVLPVPAAQRLSLSPGEELELTRVQAADERITVRISGTYRVVDSLDPFWWERPLEIEGRRTLDFTTFGPLVVPETTFFRVASEGAEMRWRAAVRAGELTVPELPELRTRLARLESRLNAGRDETERFALETGLGPALEQAERSLVAARSGVLVPTVQLGILAGAALLFLAGLLAERRSVESAILRSRGASPGEIGILALVEGAFLAFPAALVAPWLAALSLQAFNHVGPLAEIDLQLDPRVSLESYALALAAAALCACALAAPALRTAGVAALVREQGRPSPIGFVRRAGLDLVLVALAGLAYWQLRRYEGPIVESIGGRLGIDPLLVAAPALGLLAGAVLSLRVVPTVAALAERAAAPLRGLVSPLATRELARRPHRSARAALLLTLALAIGLFASAYSSTWLRSQEDRATYESGADVRVTPDTRTGSLPPIRLARAYSGLPGVHAALPLVSASLDLPGTAEGANLLAVDAFHTAEAVHLRRDLADTPAGGLLAPLAARRVQLPARTLTGEPQRLDLTVTLELRSAPRALPGRFFTDALGPYLALVLRDSQGLLHRFPVGFLRTDGKPHRFVVDVAGGGQVGYPLELVSFEFQVNPLYEQGRSGRLTVEFGPPIVGADGARWTADASESQGLNTAAEVLRIAGDNDALLTLDFTSGSTLSFFEQPATTFTAIPEPAAAPQTLPAVVTDRFLEVTGSKVGDPVSLGPQAPRLLPVESVRGFPTLPPEAPGLVVDLPTYLAANYLRDGSIPRPEEWWLDVVPGREETVARRLAAPPYSSREVIDRIGTARSLTRDPVALGLSGALSLGFVAAAVFAVVGFAVSAAVSGSERTTEFAVLRALGLSRRQLSGWLALEGGLVALIALAGGIGLGALVAWLVLPFVSLAGEGERPFPAVIVELSWADAGVVAAGMLVVLAVVVGSQISLLRRIDLAPTLRRGADL